MPAREIDVDDDPIAPDCLILSTSADFAPDWRRHRPRDGDTYDVIGTLGKVGSRVMTCCIRIAPLN